MKKLIISFICIIAMICPSHAQKKIVGDMNDDGKLNIADITVLVNTLLGKTAQREITSGDGLDMTSLIGTWSSLDGKTMTIKADGYASLNTKSVVRYEYNPTSGSLLFYNSSNRIAAVYEVVDKSDDVIYLYDELGSGSSAAYYPSSKFATNISISTISVTIFIDNTYELALAASPSDALIANTSWSSSNESVATVSTTGVVTGKSAGTATITAKTADGKTSTCTVRVRKPVESITFPYTKLNIPVGSTCAIPYKVEPYDASVQLLSWTSNKPAITSVSNGMVTANASGYTTITATTTDGTNLKASCAIQSINATPTGLTLSKSSVTLTPKATYQLSATIAPSTASSLTVIWSSSNESVATVDKNGKVTVSPDCRKNGVKATITAKIAGTSIKSSCTVTVDISSLYVDLGLPSGTLWATMNVGASSPEENGGYYAWGETKAYGEEDTSNNNNYIGTNTYFRINYSWATYKWCESYYLALTKYSFAVDNKITLVLADDAAYVNWGTNWRMPTNDEWTELRTNCTWTWTTINGKSGYKVSSKKDSSKYIFLPAAGHRRGFDDISESYYSSSSLCVDTPRFVYGVNIKSGGVSSCYDIARYYGVSVRPVRR